jgi:hypothetical protein
MKARPHQFESEKPGNEKSMDDSVETICSQGTGGAPMLEAPLPRPTAEGLDSLSRVLIPDWAVRSLVQQAICVALFRGYDNLATIATYLGLEGSVVEAEVKGLWGYLLWEDARRRIQFK